jgi:hypothetical protein
LKNFEGYEKMSLNLWMAMFGLAILGTKSVSCVFHLVSPRFLRFVRHLGIEKVRGLKFSEHVWFFEIQESRPGREGSAMPRPWNGGLQLGR